MENYPKYWKKAIKGSVGGRKLNKKGDPEEFLLKGDPTNPKADKDGMTLEIDNAEAEKYFKKNNKSAIVQGYLIEISEHTLSLDETNAVSDGYLRDLLKSPISKMRVRVDKFTSPIPVLRLLEFAREENKPIKTIEYLSSVAKRLDNTSVGVVSAEIGDVKVKTI
jgi:hypothetical protein